MKHVHVCFLTELPQALIVLLSIEGVVLGIKDQNE